MPNLHTQSARRAQGLPGTRATLLAIIIALCTRDATSQTTRLFVDKEMLIGVCGNACSNAIHLTPMDTDVRLRLIEGPGELRRLPDGRWRWYFPPDEQCEKQQTVIIGDDTRLLRTSFQFRTDPMPVPQRVTPSDSEVASIDFYTPDALAFVTEQKRIAERAKEVRDSLQHISDSLDRENGNDMSFAMPRHSGDIDWQAWRESYLAQQRHELDSAQLQERHAPQLLPRDIAHDDDLPIVLIIGMRNVIVERRLNGYDSMAMLLTFENQVLAESTDSALVYEPSIGVAANATGWLTVRIRTAGGDSGWSSVQLPVVFRMPCPQLSIGSDPTAGDPIVVTAQYPGRMSAVPVERVLKGSEAGVPQGNGHYRFAGIEYDPYYGDHSYLSALTFWLPDSKSFARVFVMVQPGSRHDVTDEPPAAPAKPKRVKRTQAHPSK